MKIKLSKKLQSALEKVGLRAPKDSADADRMSDLFDMILRNSQRLSVVEAELYEVACRELDQLAAKMVIQEVENAVKALS